MMTIFILGTLKFSCRQALFPGFIPLSSTTASAKTFEVVLLTVKRWAVCFLIAMFIGASLLYFAPNLLRQFSALDYVLALFVGIVNLIGIFSRSESIKNLLSGKWWIYALGILQGLGASGSLIWIYAITTEISFLTVLTVCTIYAVIFCAGVSFLSILIGYLTRTSTLARTALIVFFSLMGITIAILHFYISGMI
jgi:hypothetical protein